MIFILSSRNPNKVEELRSVIRGIGHDLISLLEYERKYNFTLPEVEETEDTFCGNAKLKAMFLYNHCKKVDRNFGFGVLADDSGLVVPLLDGEPGVHSARYAQGQDGKVSHDNNIVKLHHKLRNCPKYQGETPAYFQTVIVSVMDFLAGGEPHIIIGEGRCEGKVIDKARGEGGFGYDPIFIPSSSNPQELTFAEMEQEMKNAISHRFLAIRDLIEKIKSV